MKGGSHINQINQTNENTYNLLVDAHIKCLNHVEALESQLKQLEKCYIVTNQSWVDIATQLAQYKKALELACTDIAEDYCPFNLNLVNWEECGVCSHDCELHTSDRDRDINCWAKYYLNKVKE